MILGVGLDLVEIGRIRRALGRHGGRFGRKLFTEGEAAYCLSRARPEQYFASRFAAKEAASKALGTGMRGVSFKEIEVRRLESGRPEIVFHGRAAERAEGLGVKTAHVSMTHSDTHAAAVVVLEG